MHCLLGPTSARHKKKDLITVWKKKFKQSLDRRSIVVKTKKMVGRLRKVIENSALVLAFPYAGCHAGKCTTASFHAATTCIYTDASYVKLWQ